MSNEELFKPFTDLRGRKYEWYIDYQHLGGVTVRLIATRAGQMHTEFTFINVEKAIEFVKLLKESA